MATNDKGTPRIDCERLKQLYPTHADCVEQVESAAKKSRDAGFLREPEQEGIVEQAKAAKIPQ